MKLEFLEAHSGRSGFQGQSVTQSDQNLKGWEWRLAGGASLALSLAQYPAFDALVPQK